jgi:3-hydroxyacyl-[acyl-carrier-protein] dehydratase
MNDAGATLEAVDIMDILQALPHRYPFLMIDRIVGIRGDECAIGIKNVTYNEPQFLGHFPRAPVFPGVLMIEGMAQTAGVICLRAIGAVGKPMSVYFLTIDKAKFRKPVRPGDTVEYHITKKNRKKSMWWYYGQAKVAGQTVAEAEIGAMFVDE